jgi:hypothetical protein
MFTDTCATTSPPIFRGDCTRLAVAGEPDLTLRRQLASRSANLALPGLQVRVDGGHN